MKNLLDSLRGSSRNAAGEAGTAVATLQELRSGAAASNARLPGAVELANLPQIPASGMVFGSEPGMYGVLLQGLRNRLFLKYLAVDYEFYNVQDIRYRSAT